MKYLAMACAAALMLAVPARADIERKAMLTCENGQNMICWVIWPALPAMAGWHQDEDASHHFHANILVPDGQTFAKAPIALSGNVVAADHFKTDHPKPDIVDSFIDDDLDATRKDNPGVEIAETEPLTAADGLKIRVFAFHKLRDGHSQLLAYTFDGDKDGKFFVMLMLDALNEDGLKEGTPAFQKMIAAYKHYKEN
jgi:hypothetical protein